MGLFNRIFKRPDVRDSDIPDVRDSDIPDVRDSDIPDVRESDIPKVPRRRRSLAYNAASTSRLFADVMASMGSADNIIEDSLEVLRARSRDFERNNEYFGQYLNLMKAGVVGHDGIKLRMNARNPDGGVDKAGNQMVTDAWAEFSHKRNLMIDGRWSMMDLQLHASVAIPRDGELILRKIVSKRMPLGIGLQVIEPDLLDEKLNVEKRQGRNEIRMGVEIDEFRRPVAYHFLRNHPGDNRYTTYTGSKHIRVPADEIIHVYSSDRSMQTRGVPWGARVIRSLKMLHGYREAELVAARAGASKMGFFTSPAGDGFTADDYEDGVGGRENQGSPIMDAEPGTFHQLPAGTEFTSYDPDHPNTGFGDFERAILRGVASGLGMNYPGFANDFSSVSYSSIRHGALAERDFYRTVQKFLIDHLMDEIFRWWLEFAMDFGILPFSGDVKFSKFYRGAVWKPRGFAWVDPEKEMRANIIALENGLTSHSEIVSAMGRDVDEVFSEIERDRDAANRYGSEIANQPFGSNKEKIEAWVAENVGDMADDEADEPDDD